MNRYHLAACFVAGLTLLGTCFSAQLSAQDDLPNVDFDFEFDEDAAFPDAAREDQLDMLAGVVGTVVLVVALIILVLEIVLLVMNYGAANSIPADHQQVAPWMVFLLLIPCVNIIMVFIVFPKIASGFQSYFNSIGRNDVGDCGAGLALATAICLLLLGPVGVVLWIVLTLKFNGYKKQIGHV